MVAIRIVNNLSPVFNDVKLFRGKRILRQNGPWQGDDRAKRWKKRKFFNYKGK
jgi:hypothetical protein